MLSLVLIKNPECANPYHENPPNRILKTGSLNSTLWTIRCSLNPKAQAVNKAQRHLRPEPYFPEIFQIAGSEDFKNIAFFLSRLQKYPQKK